MGNGFNSSLLNIEQFFLALSRDGTVNGFIDNFAVAERAQLGPQVLTVWRRKSFGV